MKILVLANDLQRSELLRKTVPAGTELVFAGNGEEAFYATEADVYFHLGIDHNSKVDIQTGKPVFVNAVVSTLRHLPANAIRINAWPGFLQRPVVELAAADSNKLIAGQVMHALGWQFRFVPDIAGMVAARTICMIINEAYHALGEQVSSAEEIDTAMKLGTNYPYGPFEWAEKIGLKNISDLLEEMKEGGERYTVAPALQQAILQSEGLVSRKGMH